MSVSTKRLPWFSSLLSWSCSKPILMTNYRTAENNISSGSYHFAKVRQTFSGAYEILTTKAYQVAKILEQKRNGRYTSLRGGRHERGRDYRERDEIGIGGVGVSMLDGIVKVSQEVIKFFPSRYSGLTCGTFSSLDHQPPSSPQRGLQFSRATRYARCRTQGASRIGHRFHVSGSESYSACDLLVGLLQRSTRGHRR
jgi:hypothetical protein